MPAAWRRVTCTVCGNEFMTQSGQAKYCSQECRLTAKRRSTAEWQKHEAEWKAKRHEVKAAQIREAGRRCNGCVWKTPGGHFCVMPTCLKSLGAVGERGKDVQDV